MKKKNGENKYLRRRKAFTNEKQWEFRFTEKRYKDTVFSTKFSPPTSQNGTLKILASRFFRYSKNFIYFYENFYSMLYNIFFKLSLC